MTTVLRYDNGGWAERVGNHVALDLVNTVAWRLDPARRVDRLADGASLVRWVRFVGVIDDDRRAALLEEVARDDAAAERVAADVRQARELLYSVLQSLATAREPDPGDVVALQDRLVSVLDRAELASVLPTKWSHPLESLVDLPVALGLQVWSLLQEDRLARLRQCQDASCGWLFLDRTRNGSRVWCSSADCGNRTRARRHYQRHAGTAT